MDFAFSSEQEQLRSAARDYLDDRFPIESVISRIDVLDRGFDAAGWRQLANLGWLDPDLTVLDLAVLAEESAASLLPLPWWSTMALAMPLLDEELRAAVSAGERAVTVATGSVVVEGNSLTGTIELVPDLAVVTDVVVLSDGNGFVVDLTDHPECVVRRSTIDRSRPLGTLVLDATPARSLGSVAIDRNRALALASCEAVGVAQRALDLAGSYTKERQQFGRIIGTYQGVSHRVANCFVAVQLARSMAYWAAWAVDSGDAAADLAVAGAKSCAGENAVFTCEQAIQAHGGIGFTWEHQLHRFYKRAQWIDSYDGTGRDHRRAIAEALLSA